MATLASIRLGISTTIQNLAYIDTILDARINDCITSIAGGIRMPNGQISPPLPDLCSSATVSTSTSAAYKTLGTTYQRNVFSVINNDGDKIPPPRGGSYYDFMLFLNSVTEPDLSESGEIYCAAVKGSNLYYQGIPSVSEDLTVRFYRLPVDLTTDSGVPDGIPEHLQLRLIKHYVCKDIFGENISNNPTYPGKVAYHDNEFYRAMQDLVDFIGIDAEPVYYGSDDFVDLGTCD